MSAIGREIACIADAHERIISALKERPMTTAYVASITGLPGATVSAVMRTLERGGRIRFTRGSYELTHVHASAITQSETIRESSETPAPIRATKALKDATPPPTSETAAAAPPVGRPMDTDLPPVPRPQREWSEQDVPLPEPFRIPQENTMPRGVYDRKKATAAAKHIAPKRAPNRTTQHDPAIPAVLLIPEQKKVGAELVDGLVQIAHDAENLVTLTPWQMDRLVDWWSRARPRDT